MIVSRSFWDTGTNVLNVLGQVDSLRSWDVRAESKVERKLQIFSSKKPAKSLCESLFACV